MSQGASLVNVFAGSAVEASLVRSFLESHSIASTFVDEHLGTIAPHIAAGGGAGAVKVAVAGGEAQRTRELLADRGRSEVAR